MLNILWVIASVVDFQQVFSPKIPNLDHLAIHTKRNSLFIPMVLKGNENWTHNHSNVLNSHFIMCFVNGVVLNVKHQGWVLTIPRCLVFRIDIKEILHIFHFPSLFSSSLNNSIRTENFPKLCQTSFDSFDRVISEVPPCRALLN